MRCKHGVNHDEEACIDCVDIDMEEQSQYDYERARAAGFSEAIEMACSLVAKNVSQYGAALRELRALVPSTSRCTECGLSKECHAENPVTAHRFAPAKTEEPK